MADIVISVVGILAEYTVAPVLRQFGYLIYYKSNVQALTEKVTTLIAKRDAVQVQVEEANKNLEPVLPDVQNWLDRVKQTIAEKESCFEKGREARATTCCSSSGWCPNLMVRRSLSRRATKLAPTIDGLLKEHFGPISGPAPPPKPDYPAITYYEESTEAPAKPHEGASSSSGTFNPTNPPAPLNLSQRQEYRLPYTKDLLMALQDDKITVIGISGTIREIDTVTTKEFTKRIQQRNLFGVVVMAVVSQDPDLKRIQDEIAEMLDLQLENRSLVKRAERLRARLLVSDSKKILVILADVWGIVDLEAIGISHVDIKIMLISELPDVFGEMETRSNFKLLLHSSPRARPVGFDSRKTVIRDVMDALTDEESNPIVICGMGGIGKTTLVMEIGAKAGEVELFDYVAVAEFTEEPDLRIIQGKLAKGLGLKAGDDRAANLRERLSSGGKRTLVILDNVWETQLNLWDVGIPISSDPKSCKVLVSSRNRDIFIDMKTTRTFPIDKLPHDEAWDLFKKMTGDFIESEDELRGVANQVLNECDGLPVAIVAVGKALIGGRISAWRNALRQLQQASPEDVPEGIKEVYGKIEFSYKCLPDEQAKTVFLLCGLLPKIQKMSMDYLIVSAIGLGLLKGIGSISAGRDCIETSVEKLRRRSLLLEPHDDEEVRMHDVVRAAAVYIASKKLKLKKNDPLDRKDVLKQFYEFYNNMEDIVYNGFDESEDDKEDEEVFMYGTVTTNMRSTELLLIGLASETMHRNDEKLRMPVTVFNGMEDLKVLFIIESSITSLPAWNNLQTLVLVNCHVEFDVIGELPALLILDLSGSDIEHLPATFKKLSKLKLLNLTGCKKLKEISPGVISSLSRLEELYMLGSFEGYWVVEKLGSRETANWISQLEDENAEPEQVDMWKSLNRLAVEEQALTEEVRVRRKLRPSQQIGFLFTKFVDDLEGDYDRLTSWAKSMDWSLGLLSELLSLSHLTTLEVALPPIETLGISRLFHKLERFRISIGWRENNRALEDNCLRICDLNARSLAGTGISLLLKKAKTLMFAIDTKNLTDSLNVLAVNYSANLEALTLLDYDSPEYLIDMTLDEHTSRTVFPVLNFLKIYGGKRLREIFHGDQPPGSLRKLETLWLYHLPELTTLWTIDSQSGCMGDLLAVVYEIDIRDCQSLEAIFGLEGSGHHVKEINFRSLTNLDLENLPSFTGISKSCERQDMQLEASNSYPNSSTVEHSLFSDPKVIFPVLKRLNIKGLAKLTNIWNSQLSPTSFPEIQCVVVEDCDRLLHLVTTQMQNGLQKLENIRVKNCSSLEEIFEVRRFTVNEGNASFSQSDEVLPNVPQPDQGKQMKNVMDFKQSCQGLKNLTTLSVSSCGNLRYLLSPSIARGLVMLQTLRIVNCQKMEAIVAVDEGEETEDKSMLPQLSSLALWDLANLESFSQGKYTFDWPLKQIQIENCNQMNKFCLGFLTIPSEVKIIIRRSGENLEQELNDSRIES